MEHCGGRLASTEAIREELEEDWDLPTLEVMVATVRCEEIARKQLFILASDKRQSSPEIHAELKAIAADGVDNVAKRVIQLVATALAEFDEGCADADISQVGWENIRAHSSRIRDELKGELESHAAASVIHEVVLECEDRLERAISCPAAALLEAGAPDTWPSLRKLVSDESELAVKEFAAALAKPKLNKAVDTKSVAKLRVCGQNALRRIAKNEARKVPWKMMYRWAGERFCSVFGRDADSNIRTWKGDEDVRAITKDARTVALELLSVLAAIRLEENTTDGIESALLGLLGDNHEEASTSGSNNSAESTVPTHLDATPWDGVAREDILLTAVQCENYWKWLKMETEFAMSQARLAHVSP